MDAWLTRMYERHATRYLWGAVAIVVAAEFLLVVPLDFWVPSHYERLSFEEAITALLLSAGLMVLYGAFVVRVLWSQWRALLDWASGRREPEVVAAASAAAFGLPRRLVMLLVLGFVFIALPFGAWFLTAHLGRTTRDAVEIALGGIFAGVFSLLLIYAFGELALRPVRASLRLYSRSQAPPFGFAARLLLFVLFPMIAGIAVGGLTVTRDSGSFFLIDALSLAMTVMAALIIIPLVTSGALGPVRDLIRGTRAVGRGELDTQVPITSDDELGELTGSFNDMVRRLQHNSAELQASQARIVATADGERRRMERDLHDGAQQHLVLLKLKLGIVGDKVRDDPETATLISELQDDLGTALAELRDLAHGIYPALLEHEGLPGALRSAVENSPLDAKFESDGAGRYRPDLEAAVYFCCLEALQNAAKHAADSSVVVRLSDREGTLWFEIADTGPGFDPASQNGSAGLQNMSDRIGALGGTLDLVSAPGQGTTVSGRVVVGAEKS